MRKKVFQPPLSHSTQRTMVVPRKLFFLASSSPLSPGRKSWMAEEFAESLKEQFLPQLSIGFPFRKPKKHLPFFSPHLSFLSSFPSFRPIFRGASPAPPPFSSPPPSSHLPVSLICIGGANIGTSPLLSSLLPPSPGRTIIESSAASALFYMSDSVYPPYHLPPSLFSPGLESK